MVLNPAKTPSHAKNNPIYKQKQIKNNMRHLKSLLLCMLFPLTMMAQGWSTDYAAIEKSIRQVTFPDKSFDITKYGASTTASPAKNQTAINKAIDACSKAGGGRVVIPPAHGRLVPSA